MRGKAGAAQQQCQAQESAEEGRQTHERFGVFFHKAMYFKLERIKLQLQIISERRGGSFL